MKQPYYLDLFAGIGGFALGAKLAGFKFDKQYFSEVDDFAIAIYKNIDYAMLPAGDWFVSGGFPCQPHSLAGKMRGIDDERDLWSECERVLRDLRPRVALFENVPAILTSNSGQFFNRLLSGISACGYDAEWQTISAGDFGAPHERKRLWLIAYPAGFGRRVLPATGIPILHQEGYSKEHSQWETLQLTSAGIYNLQYNKADEDFICRMDDGIPLKLDKRRLKALGNGVLPQIAKYLWDIMKTAYEEGENE